MKSHYTQDVSDIPKTAPKPYLGPDDPSGYLPDQNLVEAVNVALTLGKPLLLTGDPGTGKTQLAHSLAWQLWSRRRLERSSRKPDPREVRDEIDEHRARSLLHVRRDPLFPGVASGRRPGGATATPLHHLQRARPRGAEGAARRRRSRRRCGPTSCSAPPTRTVVLIDEVDKAPRDFPNDLLNEIDEMYFRIPELDNVKIGGRELLTPDMRPIVVITSNSEKSLPDPFLRRCIYYHIPFPEHRPRSARSCYRASRSSRRRAVRSSTTPSRSSGGCVTASVVESGRRRRPSCIDWLMFMLATGARMDQEAG